MTLVVDGERQFGDPNMYNKRARSRSSISTPASARKSAMSQPSSALRSRAPTPQANSTSQHSTRSSVAAPASARKSSLSQPSPTFRSLATHSNPQHSTRCLTSPAAPQTPSKSLVSATPRRPRTVPFPRPVTPPNTEACRSPNTLELELKVADTAGLDSDAKHDDANGIPCTCFLYSSTFLRCSLRRGLFI